MTEEEKLRERVEEIVRSMVSYDDESEGIDRIMALFREYHCASCDMHSCGDRRPPSLESLRWPIERLNPQSGQPWMAEELRAMGISEQRGGGGGDLTDC